MKTNKATPFPVGGGAMGERIGAHDWARTPLGALEAWPAALKFAVNAMASSPLPQCLLWGQELTVLYNDAYQALRAERTDGFGKILIEVWPEVWAVIAPLADKAMSGEGTFSQERRFDIERGGQLEEAWFTLAIGPVHDSDSASVLGVLVTVIEITEKVMAHRRLSDDRKNIVQLFEQSPSFLAFMRGPEHVIEYVNPAYISLVGERELIGLPNAVALPESVEQGFVAMLDGVFKSGEALTATGARYDRQIIKGGPVTELYVDFVFQPILEEDGTVGGILVQGEDVTARTLADKALRDSRRALEQITESIPQKIWAARPDGGIDYINGQMTDYVGAVEWVDGRVNLRSMLHPDDLAATLHLWQACLRTGDPLEAEYRLFHAQSQSYRWNLTRATPVKDEQGQILRWYGAITDIEDQRAAMQGIIEARNAAEAADIDKSDFLARLSRDIRGPMSALVQLSDILETSGPLSPQQTEYITALKTGAADVLEQVRDLLEMTEIGVHDIELEIVTFTPPKLAEDLSNALAPMMAQKDLTLTIDVTERAHRRLRGDTLRLGQVINHLCSNAIKFTHEGGLHVTLDLAPTVNPDTALLSIMVSDTGVGIPKEKLDDLFKRSVQSDGRLAQKYGGRGLGLSLTKALVELMGGAIAVQNRPDHGSTFTVTIPLPFAATASPKATAEDLSAPSGDAGASRHSEPPLVLLAEDYEPNVIVATTLLEGMGFRVEAVGDGSAAIEKAKHGHYLFALMDVNMPGLNGLEATKQIRRHEALEGRKRLPIVGVTAHSLGGDRELCLNSGMDEYLSKPFDVMGLYDKIQIVLTAEEDNLLG